MLRATGLADATPTSTTASAAVVLMNVTSGMLAGRGSKESEVDIQTPGQVQGQGQGLVHGRAMTCALRCLSCLRQKNPAGAVAAFHAALMPGVIINIDSDRGRNIAHNSDSGDEGHSCSCSSGKSLCPPLVRIVSDIGLFLMLIRPLQYLSYPLL